METYKEIVDRMNAAYTELSGNRPEEVSDIGLRIQVLAGEIYRLQARVEWLRKQAFPFTADGKYLDQHGAQRGITRGGGEKASGALSFSRYIPITFDLVIPKGTVCASSGGEAVEYETTQDVILPAGEVTVEAPAQAVEPGSQGNAAAGYINTMVTEVTGINYVTNTQAFSGGSDPESDESYRKRILGSFGRLGSIGTAGYYEEIALAQPGVYAAQAEVDGSGNVTVYIWGNGQAPDSGVTEQVAQALEAVRPMGASLEVEAASTRWIMVACFLKMRTGASFAQAKSAVTEALNHWFAGMKLGDSATLAEITQLILSADPAITRVTFNDTTIGYDGSPGVVPAAGVIVVTESST